MLEPGKAAMGERGELPAWVVGPSVAIALVLIGASDAARAATVLTFQQGSAFSRTDATHIDSARATSPFGSSDTLEVNGAPQIRALVRFPSIFGAAEGQVPLGAAIASATLSLTTRSDGGSLAELSVHRVLSSWNEIGETWNGFNGGGVAGTNFSATADDTFIPAATDTTFAIDVTPSVQAWSAGADNFGLIVISSGSDDIARFFSDDAGAFQPVLTVAIATGVPEPHALGVAALTAVALGALRRGRASAGA